MHFSPQYFEKLRRELESAGYDVSNAWDDVWYSEPVGYFFISDCLKGECFVFLDMNRPYTGRKHKGETDQAR